MQKTEIENQKSLSSTLLLGSTAVAAFSYFSLWFQTFYFGKPTSAILSHGAGDGWCRSIDSGFGVHCWGDYQTPLLGIEMDNQWESGSAYLPITTLFFKPFAILRNLLQSDKLVLVLYLALGMAAMLLTVVHAAKKSKSNHILFFLLFGVLATPIAIAFDRGNMLMFAVPILYAYSVSVLNEKWNKSSILLVLATIIKPQFALLILPMVTQRKWKYIFFTIRLFLIVQILGFLLVDDNPIKVFNQWYQFVTAWQSGLIQEGVGGPNFSFSQTIYDWAKIGEYLLTDGNTKLSEFLFSYGQSFVYLLVVLVLSMALFCRHYFSGPGALICALALSSLVTGVSWAYYQVFALVVAGLIVQRKFKLTDASDDSSLDQEIKDGYLSLFTGRTIVVATIASCFNLPIGGEVIPFLETYSGKSVSSAIVAPLWLLVITSTMKDALTNKAKNHNLESRKRYVQ